jgi:cytochrome c biogenesis factor
MADLYASLVTVEGQTRAAFRFFVNPGIGLLWLGGGVMALGGVVAALPARPRPASPHGPEPVVERREEVTV